MRLRVRHATQLLSVLGSGAFPSSYLQCTFRSTTNTFSPMLQSHGSSQLLASRTRSHNVIEVQSRYP
jgi:hypothetical protein